MERTNGILLGIADIVMVCGVKREVIREGREVIQTRQGSEEEVCAADSLCVRTSFTITMGSRVVTKLRIFIL